MRRLTRFSAMLLLACTTPALATDYYLHATDGNDDNLGTEPSQAWQSIEKVNSSSFNSGDNIYFARSETFRGELLFNSSGTAEQPITISAYGEGEKPQILGSSARNAQTDWIVDPDSNGTLWHTTHATVGSELVSNPNFNSDVSSWVLHTNNGADASMEHDSICNCLKVTSVESGDSGYDISLFTGGTRIENGKYYILTYRAKADINFTHYWPRIKKSTSPWNEQLSHVAIGSMDVTAEWQNYQVLYQANIDDTDNLVNWPLGQALPDGATFYLDDVSFKEIDLRSIFPYDVGFVLLGEEAQENVGTKVSDKAELDADKKYWYDENSWQVFVYSSLNPAVQNSSNEIARAYYAPYTKNLINFDSTSHIRVENISVRYSNSSGIYLARGEDIIISNTSVGYCGGQRNSTGRYGTGIRVSVDVINCTLENNHIFQIYDPGITLVTGGDEANCDLRNINVRNNVIDKCSDGIEVVVWGGSAANVIDNILLEGNTLNEIGYGWNSGEGFGFDIWRASGAPASTVSNISAVNNTVNNSLYSNIEILRVDGFFISGNIFTNSAASGISIRESGWGQIINNIVLSPANYGIVTTSSGNLGPLFFSNNIVQKSSSGYAGLSSINSSSNSVWLNNAVHCDQAYAIQKTSTVTDTFFDHNCYYRADGGNLIAFDEVDYSTDEFSNYQSTTSQDLNTLADNCLLLLE